jgi:glyoxylase-like metal-dependent hydrolase (beta-lactamase superfamily II)
MIAKFAAVAVIYFSAVTASAQGFGVQMAAILSQSLENEPLHSQPLTTQPIYIQAFKINDLQMSVQPVESKPAEAAPTKTVAAQATQLSAAAQPYEVFAIRYASIPDFPVNALIAGADPARKFNIAMTIWLIRGNGRNILVDSGFYRPQFFKQFKVDAFIKPSEAISQPGIMPAGQPALKPEDITDVVITHMHWDHADGLDLFPNARIWLQKDEYGYYTGEAWQEKGNHGGIDPDDVLAAVKLNLAGRVRLINGDAQEILPGITCYIGGKHTFQSQFVGVNTKAGTVILASDNMYLYENLEKHVPIAQTLDGASNLRAQDRMKQLAASPRLIVPGHDPLVFERFPKLKEGVVGIE